MKPKGTLIAIGGNEDKKFEKVDEKFQPEFGEGVILRSIINEAGGEKSRIEVITSASGVPEVVGKKYKDVFAELNAENVGILDIRNRSEAEMPKILKRMEKADALMFSGGDQSDISRIFRDTKAHKLICERYLNEAFVVAGTSAGAMAMSEEMIAGGKYGNIFTKNCIKMGKGLGFMKEVIFDTHFIRRGRFGRLGEAVALHPDKLGMGLGEDTGVIITEGNCCEIIGSGMVILFDGTEFSHNRYHTLKEEVPISLGNLTVHILARCDKYYIREKKMDIHYNPKNHREEVSVPQ